MRWGGRGNDFDVPAFRAEIERFAPRVVAFNGKKAASLFFNVPTSEISYGKHVETLGSAGIWILPSTSGGARGSWNIDHWQTLADSIQ